LLGSVFVQYLDFTGLGTQHSRARTRFTHQKQPCWMRQILVLRPRLECHWWPHLMRQSLALRRRSLEWWQREQRQKPARRTRQSCCWLRPRPERSSWSQNHRCRRWPGQCPLQSRRRCLRRRGRDYQILRLANMSLLSSLLHRACAQARARTKSLPVQTLLWWLQVQDETGCGFRGRGGGTEGSSTEGSSSQAPRCRRSGASTEASTPERWEPKPSPGRPPRRPCRLGCWANEQTQPSPHVVLRASACCQTKS
jgi:hypothetical protein